MMGTPQSGLLEQLVESIPNGILVTDSEGLIILVNPAARGLIPMIPDPIGRSPVEAVPIPEVVDALLYSHAEAIDMIFGYGSKDLRLRSVPLKAFGRLLIIENISQLRKAEQYRREFVANVSHELRTPATSIIGYSEMLLDDKDKFDEDTGMMVEVIHRNALRLNSLFEDLLTLTKIDEQRVEMTKEAVRLLPIVMESVDKQEARAEARGVKFQIMVSENLQVFAHRDAMIHIVGNLIENAVKYNKDDGLVTIRADYRVDKDKVLLEVIDLGIGIAPSQQGRIFERFFRVDKGRSRAVGGTGLGLSIVKRLVEKMGAHIELRSRVGSGSIFRVWLDACEDSV